MKAFSIKKRIKKFIINHKTICYLVFLLLLLSSGLTVFFLFGRVSPNDKIYIPERKSIAFLENQNPKFSVKFGTVEQPDKQYIRFEADTSVKNPFIRENRDIISKALELFQKKERYGIEMSLVGVGLEKDGIEKYDKEILRVADIIGVNDIKTTTELIDSGRELGKFSKNCIISKQTVLNKKVAEGIDLEYQILKGLGLKEEIIIKDLEAYRDSCIKDNCKLPLNEFLFDLKLDEGVRVKEGWFTIDGKSTNTYYFVDSKGRYLAHFLPNFAVDSIGGRTSDVDLKVEQEEGSYRIKVIVDINWLLDGARVFPVRIDPSIVHDDTADFSGGIFNRTESVTGPKIKLKSNYNSGEYISSPIDIGSTVSGVTLSWTPSGINTGNGETPYSTTGLVAQWNFNETSGTTAATSGGSCGASCNLTLTNMVTSGQDADIGSGWTAKSRRWGVGAIILDGTNDNASCTDANCGGTSYLDIGARSWSIAAWIKTNKSARQMIAGKGAVTKQYSYSLESGRTGSGLPEFILVNSADGVFISAIGTTRVDDGMWHYLVGTYDGTTATMYVDGIVENTSTTKSGTQVTDSTSNFEIGGRAAGTALQYKGIIDSVSIYSRALSADEVFSNYQAGNIEFLYRVSVNNVTWSDWTSYNSPESDLAWESFDGDEYLYSTTETGLVGYWPMDEISGSSVEDVVNSNTGSASGTTIVGGIHGKARDFSSGDDISLGNLSILDGASNVTIEAWIYPTEQTASTMYRVFTENYVLSVGQYGTQAAFYMGNGSAWSTRETSGGSLTINTWNYVSFVKSGTSAYVYINGALSKSGIVAPTILGTSNTTNYISTYDGSSDSWKGYIDEVRVSNIAKTVGQIRESYSEGLNSIDKLYVTSDSVIKTEGSNSRRIQILEPDVDANTVALWHLDEITGSGAYLKDSGSTGADISPTGTTYKKNGRIGGARSFNGSGNYLAVSSGFSKITTLTVSLWFKTSSSSRQMLFGQTNELPTSTPSSYTPTLLIQTDGKIRAEYWTGSIGAITSTSAYNNGAWHYVSFIGSGTSQQLYIDGVSIGTRSGTINHSGWIVTTIGAAYDNTGRGAAANGWAYFNGEIDEVQISKVARTADEINESYKSGMDRYVNKTIEIRDISSATTLPISVAGDRPGSYLSMVWGETGYANYLADENTVGFWHLDEGFGSGAYIKDVSGFGNHATPTGTTYLSTGVLGGARNFSGSSQYISRASIIAYNESRTVDFWFKTNAIGAQKGIVSSGNAVADTTPVWMIVQKSSNVLSVYHAGSYRDGTTPITTGVWYHAAYSYDATNDSTKLYLNGKLEYSGTVAATNLNNTNLYIGTGYGGYFNGSIDEVRISNVVRSEDDILQAYEVGLRTHNITVDFGASLVSGNLIDNSGDKSFSIDATVYGLSDLGSGIYPGEKIIVKETYDGTEYIAQGTVSSVNESTGAVSVSSWDSNSTFPSGGYTIGADVFKWQREYIPVKNRTINTQVDAIAFLTLRITNTNERRNIWIDNLRSSTGYLSNYTGKKLTFPSGKQYFQYKVIFSTWNKNISPYISQVQIDYDDDNEFPTMYQIMRHGKWFNSNGVKQPFWWVNK